MRASGDGEHLQRQPLNDIFGQISQGLAFDQQTHDEQQVVAAITDAAREHIVTPTIGSDMALQRMERWRQQRGEVVLNHLPHLPHLPHRHGRTPIGDGVLGYTAWQRFDTCHANDLRKLDPEMAPVSTALGVLGMPGRTAWFGLMEAGRPRPGETLLVSAAAGAVGSLVSQFGKRAGCRVFGIAGGAAKCDYLIQTPGLDGAIDYKAFDHADALAATSRPKPVASTSTSTTSAGW